MNQEAIDRIAKCAREGLCLACLQPLGTGKVVRQCHERCDQATRRAILRRYFTEAQRVREGKYGKAKRGGRPPVNPVTKEAMGLS